MLRKAISAISAALGLLSPVRATAAPGDAPPYVAAFDKAFAPSFSVETRDEYQGKTRVETVPFKMVEAGTLMLPSGKVCAADPFIALSDAKPFTQQVPAGAFPVRLAVGEFPSGGSRVTFARIDFKQAPVVRWSMAVIEGQDIATLKKDEIFGYGVDAGTGSFFDPIAGRAAGEALSRAREEPRRGGRQEARGTSCGAAGERSRTSHGLWP